MQTLCRKLVFVLLLQKELAYSDKTSVQYYVWYWPILLFAVLVLHTDEVQLPPVDFGPPVEKLCENVNMLTFTGLVSESFFVFSTCVYVCMYVLMNMNIYIYIYIYIYILAGWKVKIKIKQSCNRRGQTLRAAGG
jgi:hypothetical protein